MPNKERSPGQTLAQLSMSKDLLVRAKAYAKKREIPFATWVRSLIITELESNKELSRPQFLSAPAGVRVAGPGDKPCPIVKRGCRQKAVNS